MFDDHFTWWHLIKEGIPVPAYREYTKYMTSGEEKYQKGQPINTIILTNSIFKCEQCHTDCHSKIGHFCHHRYFHKPWCNSIISRDWQRPTRPSKDICLAIYKIQCDNCIMLYWGELHDI